MPKPPPNRDRLTFYALAVVLGGWVLTLIASIVVPGYTPPQSVTMAIMTVLGGLFGGVLLQRGQIWARTNKDEDSEDPQDSEPSEPPPGPPVAKHKPGTLPAPHKPHHPPHPPPAEKWPDEDTSE